MIRENQRHLQNESNLIDNESVGNRWSFLIHFKRVKSAMSDYLVYWKPTTVADGDQLSTIEHSASNQYGKLSRGDVLWIVTSEGSDDLLLIGRQKVDHIVGQSEAETRLQNRNLWKADHHVLCDAPEEKLYLDLSRWASQLAFDGVVAQLPGGFTGQHLQTMRLLDFSSARLLESLWAQRDAAVNQAAR